MKYFYCIFFVFIISFFNGPTARALINNHDDRRMDIVTPTSRRGYFYSCKTLADQEEILKFIKSLDFDKYPPAKKLVDFYHDEKKLPDDKVLTKGIKMFEEGKIKKALNYFLSINENAKKYSLFQRKYAGWQLLNYYWFGDMDPYFNGFPTNINRENAKLGTYEIERYISGGCAIFYLWANPDLPSYDPDSLLKTICGDSKVLKDKVCSDPLFTEEFLAAVLYEAFPKGVDVPIDPFMLDPLYCEGDRSEMADNLNQYFNFLDCLHLVARTNSDVKDCYGIGLSAEELYNEAKNLKKETKYDLYDYRVACEDLDIGNKATDYLLRSAYCGNIDALVELGHLIIQHIQEGVADKMISKNQWDGLEKNDRIAQENHINYWSALQANAFFEFNTDQIKVLKEYPYIWKAFKEFTKSASRDNYKIEDSYLENKREEKRAKRRERAQNWYNMAGIVLEGLYNSANVYLSSKYSTNAQNYYSSSSSTPLADALSQPGYLQGQFNALLQQSIGEVQQREWQDYMMMRQAYQRMGKDLSIDEYRQIVGRAIADLKGQGIDIIGEQQALNREMSDFNRNNWNSGKENVERIKEQNRLKMGGTSSSGSTSSGGSTRTSSTATTSKGSTVTSSSTTSESHSGDVNFSGTTSNNAYDSHAQYANGNLNTSSSEYGNKLKNVSMSVKDGSSYRSVSLSGELYKKNGQYFVKIGNSFFLVEHSGGRYNSYIIYGAKAHYFNK